MPTNFTHAKSRAHLTMLVQRNMDRGIAVLPGGYKLDFNREARAAFSQAVFLGTLTYDELDAATLPPLDLRPGAWPSSSVTCQIADDEKRVLVWLRRLDDCVDVYSFAKFGNEVKLLMPCELALNGAFSPIVTVLGLAPDTFEMSMNVARGSLHAGMIMLARHAAERTTA